jgi:hypothetical protein
MKWRSFKLVHGVEKIFLVQIAAIMSYAQQKTFRLAVFALDA